MTIPIDAQIAEVKREIGMRYAVYSRRVEAGKMKQETADHLIATMQAVVESLEDHKRLQEAKL